MAVIKAVTHPIFAFHSHSLWIKAGRKVEVDMYGYMELVALWVCLFLSFWFPFVLVVS